MKVTVKKEVPNLDITVRVLVVDDMAAMRKMLIKMCKELGFYDIIEAEDGRSAWDALNKSSPPVGLIISDWNMPNGTGLDFLKRLRHSENLSKVPFIMVSAEAEQEQILEALKSGVNNYLVKPFSAAALGDKINRTINLTRAAARKAA